MWIKICGISDVENALTCFAAGADAVGFVFAESKRQLAVQAAGRIVKALPRGLEKVGVFVDACPREVAEIQNLLGLDLLQFHGRESPEYCSQFRARVIKAFKISTAEDFEAMSPYRSKIWACLLDTRYAGAAGGTGKAWDWNLVGNSQQIDCTRLRIIAAGGLNAHNVGEALDVLKPDGVDTSSGVETSGRKNKGLIKQFIDTVRRWERNDFA